jgi:hypothetical protein
MLPQVPKKKKDVVHQRPKHTKGEKEIWPIPVKRDKGEIRYRTTFTEKTNKQGLKQFCFEKDENHHYSVFPNLRVFNIEGTNNRSVNKFGMKRSGLQTANGLIIDPNKIDTEIDLVRHTKDLGFAHTSRFDSVNHKYLSNENHMFDSSIFGSRTIINYFFTYPIRNKDGLLHEDSCKRKIVTAGSYGTISFMPFSFSVCEKLKRAKNQKKFVEEFGKTREQLQSEGWIVDESAYNPTLEGWYRFWYTPDIQSSRGLPNKVCKMNRIIAIYHEVSAYSNVFETIGSKSCMGLNIFNRMYIRLLTKLVKLDLSNLATETDDKKRDQMTIDISDKLCDPKDKIIAPKYKMEMEKILYRLNPSFRAFKVLGNAKDETVIKFGYNMVVMLLP